MAAKCLTELPEELQTMIFDFLTIPSDLKNARLACKKLGHVVTARFYREVKINLKRWEQHPLYRLGREACRHIRHLRFVYPGHDPESPTDPVNERCMRQGIKELLQLLPHNLLKSFRSSTFLTLDHQTILLLAATQRDLVEISFGKIYDAYLALPDILKPWPANLKCLDTSGWYGNENDFIGYREIIHQFRGVQELVLRVNRPDESMPERPSESSWDAMQDSDQHDGLLSKMVQTHGESCAGPSKMHISNLALDEVDLYYSDRTFTKHVDFAQLRVLDLFRCAGAVGLLRTLDPYFQEHGCRLKGFTLWVERLDEPQPVLFDTEVLLAFMDHLSLVEYLTLDVWALTSPVRRSNMRKIAPTLRRLHISIRSPVHGDLREPPYYVYDLEEVHELCGRCPELTELAIPLPSIDTFDSSSLGAAYYIRCLGLFGALPKLKFFRSLTWPTVPSECIYLWGPLNRKRVNKPIFDDIMTTFAERIAPIVFESSPRARLNLLSFGDRDPRFSTASGLEYGANSRAYLVKRQPAQNAQAFEVVPVDTELIRYHLPDCSEWHLPKEVYCEPEEVQPA